MTEKISNKKTYKIYPVGYIQRIKNNTFLEILEPFRPALKQLDQFSHIMVFWWADKHDNNDSRNIVQTKLPYADGKEAGVFACRSEYRPNPIAITVCKILKIDEKNGTVQINNIDAYDGTGILDIKAYIPVSDTPH